MRRTALIILLWLSVKSFAQTHLPYHYIIPPQLNDGLQTASLQEAGIDSNRIIILTNKILANDYINIHSLLILRNNKLVYENYFPGHEDPWYGDTGIINHDQNYLHECRSITKSVVSACIGIAIAQGKIKDVNENIFSFFPEYSRYDTGMKRDMTIKDLLTMTSGIKWYEGDSSSTIQEVTMMHSDNPIEYVLSQPMAEKPGKIWNYNGGCTQVLAAIIKKVSGEEIDSFANENIFLPLGIKSFKWDKTEDGFRWCASGLRLTSRDMAKFGLLYLNKGKWNGKQIVAPNWISHSFQFYALAYPKPATYYGYQFWCFVDSVQSKQTKAAAALGNGGQFILVKPVEDLVVVVTAGNYFNEVLLFQSYHLIRDNIYPAIKPKKTKAN